MKAAQNRENQDYLYGKYWEQFDHHFWKKEEKQGRLKRPRIDLFMQHFLQVKRAKEVNIGRMFQEYKNWNKEESPYTTVENELIDLDKFAGIYRKFLSPDISNKLGVFAQKLREIDVSTTYPLLLYLIGEGNVEESEFDGIITDLESYLIRRLICGKTTKNYNKIFLQILRDYKKSIGNRLSLQASLLNLSGDAANWPDDKEYTKSWINDPVFKKLKSKKVELILRAIEDSLYTAKTERISIQSSLTIEHVMPEAWTEKWPLSDGTLVKDSAWYTWWRDTDEEKQKIYRLAYERENLIQTFGNLTLLTQSLNSSIKNGHYSIKRPEIIKQSALRMNTYFQNIEEWDETAIRKRGQDLCDIAKRIWPYPEGQQSL